MTFGAAWARDQCYNPTIQPERIDVDKLLRECLTGDLPETWSVFVSMFEPVIASSVYRTARMSSRQLRPEAAADLIQETFLRLCEDNRRALREFRSEHSGALFGLVRAVAVSTVLDHFKHESAQRRGGGKAPAALEEQRLEEIAGVSPQNALEQAILYEQIDAHLQRISPRETAARDRRVFWLYYRTGLTARAISALPAIGLSVDGVESLLRRQAAQLRSLLCNAGKGASSE